MRRKEERQREPGGWLNEFDLRKALCCAEAESRQPEDKAAAAGARSATEHSTALQLFLLCKGTSRLMGDCGRKQQNIVIGA